MKLKPRTDPKLPLASSALNGVENRAETAPDVTATKQKTTTTTTTKKKKNQNKRKSSNKTSPQQQQPEDLKAELEHLSESLCHVTLAPQLEPKQQPKPKPKPKPVPQKKEIALAQTAVNQEKKKNHNKKKNNATETRTTSSPPSRRSGLGVAPPLTREQVDQLLHNGKLLSGKLRVNASVPSDAYLTVDGIQVDLMVRGLGDRGGAQNGDQVAVKLHPKSRWLRLRAEQCQMVSTDPSQACHSDQKSTLEAIWRPHTFEAFPSLRTAVNQSASVQDPAAESMANAVQQLRETIQQLSKRPTARIVRVLEPANPKGLFLGQLVAPKTTFHKNKNSVAKGLAMEVMFAVFQARDSPQKLCIPRVQLPDEFIKNPGWYASQMLCMCQLRDFDSDCSTSIEKTCFPFPEGKFVKTMGQFDEIEPGIEAALHQNELERHALEFDEQILEELHERFGVCGEKFQPMQELAGRRDFRKERVNIFSIDPATARDLDDALHVVPLGSDVFEIGVHIADVSHFLLENSLLDQEAQRRATSVYFANRVLPMLPRLLCEKLCSLEPNEDRLAFSMTWQMHRDGTLVKDATPWFGKSIIRSCCKLDYGTAQKMIDGSVVLPDGSLDWEPNRRPVDPQHAEGTPPVGHEARCQEIIQNVKDLWQIAKERRRQRFASGALALDNVKLCFQLDEHGNPTSFREYELRDSNRLVEEFMLLANYLVAQQLLLTQGSFAFLRRHPEPLGNALRKTIVFLKDKGFELDGSDSRQLHESLTRVNALHGEEVWSVIQHLLTKPMQPAEYYVVADEKPENWRHYALNIPYYTHFTSPIRRYADVMVHRLLHESLVQSQAPTNHNDHQQARSKPQTRLDKMQTIASNCNVKKLKAKSAEMQVDRLFLNVLLKKQKSTLMDGVVVDFGGKQLAVYFPQLDVEKRFMAQEWPHRGAEWTWNSDTKTLIVKHAIGVPDNTKALVQARHKQGQQEDRNGSKYYLEVKFLQKLRFRVSTTRAFPLDLVFDWVGQRDEE